MRRIALHDTMPEGGGVPHAGSRPGLEAHFLEELLSDAEGKERLR